VVIGSIYDHQHHPPAAGEHEVVYVVPDEAASDVRRVHLEMPGGATLTFEDERVSVVLGGTSLEMKKDGDVTLTCGGNISLKSNGDVTIEAQGNLALKAQASLELSGAMIKAEGQATASLKAAQVSLAGIVQFSPS